MLTMLNFPSFYKAEENMLAIQVVQKSGTPVFNLR